MNRTRSPKTRRELALQLLLFAVPCGYVLAIGISELARGGPGTVAPALPAFLVLLAGWIGYSAWAVREYLRWSRGIRPAPARGAPGPSVQRDVPLPPELIRSPRVIPE